MTVTATSLLGQRAATAARARARGWRGSTAAEVTACCLALAAIPFFTAFGDVIADTKFELAVNPTGFLSGALTLWNPQQFGVLLNQTVGYLFPMGPFFAALHGLGVAGWVTQRLWLSALLVTAFGGTVMLTARLGIGSRRTRLAAGVAFAVSPMALGMLGQTSGEFLPMALMPWIIIPLTDPGPWGRGADGDRWPTAGRRARAAARSAVAVALCSGMNAASTIAVLLPAFIYLMTRPGAATRARMLAWWVPAVILVSLSWSVPLVLLSRYGTSIVPFTESAQVTSSTTSLLNILRGAESWIGFQTASGQPERPLAFLLSVRLVPAALSALLAALGLAGLARRDIGERRFLLCSLLAGTVILALGYVSSLGNPLEGPLIGLINGPGAPFRNLWKFDPMLRLPLAAGLAHVLAAPRVTRRRFSRQRVALAAVAAAGLASLLLPAVVTGLASPGSFSQVPGYWRSAAGWLNQHAGNQAVLAEPGSAFGEYTWGSPQDDVLQALTPNVDWVERNLEVVGSVGSERLLNTVDQQLAAGDGSAGLSSTLARMGVRYVLVRNDLSTDALAGTQLARVHDAIAASPGLTLAAQFGPQTGGGSPDSAIAGFSARYPAVQIYRVAGAQAAAVVQPAAGTLRVYGAPESLITLANQGLLGDSPVLVNGDGQGQPSAASVVTDSLRRRTDNFGELRTNYSPTLTAGQPATTFLSSDDYTEPDWAPYLATAAYRGIEDVTASTSSSDIQAGASRWATGTLPYAAFDGNPDTRWESGAFDTPVGQWIQASFDSPVAFGATAALGTVKVAFADDPSIGQPVTQVTVSTAAGSVSDPVRVTGSAQPLAVPAGPSDWLRITVTQLEDQSIVPLFGTQVAISSISVPGVSATRTIVTPAVPGPDPAAVVLAKAQPYQSGCMLTPARWVCSPQLSNQTEEQYGFSQSFTEATAEPATLSGSVLLTDPALAVSYADAATREPSVTASSTYTPDLQDQAWNAFDGSTRTGWTAGPADTHPELTINWGYQRTLSKITVKRPAGAAGAAEVIIAGSGGQRRGAVIGADGTVRFAPLKTTRLTLTFVTDQAPVQVSDVSIPGVQPFRVPAAPLRLSCGRGPQLTVDGQRVPTQVTGSYAALLNGQPLHFSACRPVRLAAGANQVTEPATDPFDVQAAVVALPGRQAAGGALAPQAGAPAAADVTAWGASQRTVQVSAAARSYLEVNQNYNAGWQAVLDGRTLTPVRLDGWKQAWVLPAGSSGAVHLSYRPAALYQAGLIAGLAGLLLCFAAAFARPRRRPPGSWPGARPDADGGPPRWPGRPRWYHRLGVAAALPALTVAGLLLGGYPGAVLLPVATALFLVRIRGRGISPGPRLLAGLFAAVAVTGAVGEQMIVSGSSGRLVTTLSNVIPQAGCLVVIAGLAAGLWQTRAADRAEPEFGGPESRGPQ